MTAGNLPAVPSDVHYEVAIDPEPDTGAEPELVDQLPVPAVTRLPVIPVHLRTIDGIRVAARYHAGLHWHRARFHGLRLPRYALFAGGWAIVGAFRVAGRQVAWAWVLEQHTLRSDAAADGDGREWAKLHKIAQDTRRGRMAWLGAEAAGLVVAGVVLSKFGPWAWSAAAAVVLPLLARAGRPADRPIISAAVVEPRFRKLSADIVLRAYYAAKLGHPEKPDEQIGFGSTMQRDGPGTAVVVDLPYGKTLRNAMEAREEIASGLDVTASQVFIHRDATSIRRHRLWVADQDPLSIQVGRTPLLACKPADVWKQRAPLGVDERGDQVLLDMLWTSILVGALPRMGKTFVARLIALFAALDPFVKLDVFDASGKPDWRKFALVADSYAFGLTPTRAGLPPEILLETLTGIKDDVQDRYHRLSQMPVDLCPEGKLTRTIARDPRHRMPVRLLVLDEVQEYFDLGPISGEIADLLVYLVKVAPAAGVCVLSATQRPSGVGSGQVATRFTAFRDNHQARFALRTSDYRVSEMVLGAGAYGEGLDSSKFLKTHKGVGILRGASDDNPTVRTYLAEGPDAERILTAARAIRERAGTLGGMALGEELAGQPVSILADVLAVMGELPGIHWEPLAALLAARWPDRYGDATGEWVSARCRGLGVPSEQVKYLGRNTNGCKRAAVQKASRQEQPR